MGTREDLQMLCLISAFSNIADPSVRREVVEFVEGRVSALEADGDEQVPDDRTS